VHQSRKQSLQQLGLTDDNRRFSTYSRWHIVKARGWLSAPDEPVEEE
jgi:hypothetical protein